MKPRARKAPVFPPAPPGPAKAVAPGLCTDVAGLPGESRLLVEKMIIEGATLEDIVEAVGERGKIRVSLQAIQNFFRSRLDLQQRRIKRQLETARALKKALGDPKSGESELADAVLLTGLMRVNRHAAEFRARDAVAERFQRDNLRLRQQTAKLRQQKFNLDKRLVVMHLKTEVLKWEVVQEKLLELRRSLESQKCTKRLGPEAFQKIQEIYGLVHEPVSPKAPEEKTTHA